MKQPAQKCDEEFTKYYIPKIRLLSDKEI